MIIILPTSFVEFRTQHKRTRVPKSSRPYKSIIAVSRHVPVSNFGINESQHPNRKPCHSCQFRSISSRANVHRKDENIILHETKIVLGYTHKREQKSVKIGFLTNCAPKSIFMNEEILTLLARSHKKMCHNRQHTRVDRMEQQ